jgi:hypothetical protein
MTLFHASSFQPESALFPRWVCSNRFDSNVYSISGSQTLVFLLGGREGGREAEDSLSILVWMLLTWTSVWNVQKWNKVSILLHMYLRSFTKLDSSSLGSSANEQYGHIPGEIWPLHKICKLLYGIWYMVYGVRLSKRALSKFPPPLPPARSLPYT